VKTSSAILLLSFCHWDHDAVDWIGGVMVLATAMCAIACQV
jgi:hypothetical protein